MRTLSQPTPITLNRQTLPRITTSLRKLAKPTLCIEITEEPSSGVHNITPELIADFRRIMNDTAGYFDSVPRIHSDIPAYAVIKSSHATYFSQGGDLAFFLSCIRRGDADALRAYSMRCLEVLMAWSSDFKPYLTTVSLVQGRALGGGFEMALSSDYIIAEEQSTFGFPEILFGLFPCTGAMGLVSARTNPYVAERLMTNKKVYSASALLEMGLIDEVCEQGAGERALECFIASHSKRRKARLKVQQSRHRLAGIDLTEATQVVDDWVATAIDLDQEEIRQLEMLILMQQGEQPDSERRKVA
ncbi:crotonase/enoyl-CoA hydratase family protein [Luteimonas suaedae]|uniref:crotonase/enoyl-CoA hydratase family protein n=1 Tax=Luteimonas suaedae TaxID=2605430 RepID=UPI0011EFB269|nr:crotonase/enoyl-CoA hydratase family protein [Luteimonas suaedae]